MEVKSAIYNNINFFQMKDAKELISKILEDHHDRTFEVILDVGCGSGNVTEILAGLIPHKRILAFDVDSKMVSFADTNNNNTGTDFVTEDVSKSWDNLVPKLKALEGQVDLIFSNYVLHWVDDKNTASENMFRLLKPDGMVYFNIGIVKPICDFVSSKTIKNEITKYLDIEDPSTQVLSWTQSLKLAGFQEIETQMINNEWKFDTSEEFMEMLLLFRNRYLKYISQQMDDESRKELVNKIEDLVFRTLSCKTGTRPMETFDKEKCHLFFDIFTVKAKAVKSTYSIENPTIISSSWNYCSIL